MKKRWWHPVKTDEKWIQRIRKIDSKETESLSDEDIRKIYAYGRKYAVTWDDYGHLHDAYIQHEKLSDAFLEIIELIEELKKEIEEL